VARVLELLKKETAAAMAMLGRGRVADLDASALEPAPV
jgi:isopentenyl diphosphate isomerase/L-lactate dehydrogenase-like FMN-dependent dehydrogenase